MIFLGRIGMRAGGGAENLIELTVAGTVYDYNVFAAASLVGDPSANVTGGIVRLLYQPGAIIGSTSTGSPACRNGSGWGAGWDRVEHVLATGGARIQGKGGNGGAGATKFVFVEGNCEPTGRLGGGGGGAGSTPGSGASSGGAAGTATAGGSGGTATQPSLCSGASDSAAGQAGGPALQDDGAGPQHYLMPAAGATLEVWGGGGGGGGAAGTGTRSGGAGGGPGQPGSAGSGGSAGGAAGAAYVVSGVGRSVHESGPGVIDKRGA